jgi:hypothetical protein
MNSLNRLTYVMGGVLRDITDTQGRVFIDRSLLRDSLALSPCQ